MTRSSANWVSKPGSYDALLCEREVCSTSLEIAMFDSDSLNPTTC